MLKIRILFAFLILFTFTTTYAQQAESFVVNPSKSLVSWAGKKIVGGNTQGTILVSNGSLAFANKQLKSGTITMDTKSINSEKSSPRLVAHLKNADFFDVEKHPTATYVITSVKTQNNVATVNGKITIKGITKDLSFPAEVTYSKDVVVAKAIGVKVNRTLFDVKYKSGSLFSGLGDGAIEDDFVLDITLVAEKK
ncbi:YceI family protein [Sphingobacterium bovistauri]|uniref:YceI family protein n=1 Tax=Sphingobacterium bovistauri TaxID=2781959 RepID=A0ABS7Z9B6_9SPHI|nr:YceI family protein [Sphingobacterium bovistauri]MCA5006787.1 YceI family protein [Sphingobacterium bovistauri]